MLTWPRFGPWLTVAISLLATPAASQSIPAPNINFDELGQVAIGGNFDAISVYQHAGQRQGFSNNVSNTVFTQLSDGFYDVLASTDASVKAMCSFVLKNNTFVGVMVGGNFTSIGGREARSVALINPTTLEIQPQPGVQGTVNAILCDKDTETIYVGGDFDTPISKNAVAWVATSGWTTLAFNGFDGPVSSIAKAPGGHIVFGGRFSGLGISSNNTSQTDQEQVINLVNATITSVANTTSGKGITCPPSNTSTNSNPWLLQDGASGYWQATLGTGFVPSKLRLYNLRQGDRGTRTWRLTALPDGGIMNFTYTDPESRSIRSCDAKCPLAKNASLEYQDFTFVNEVGMNSFRIDVSESYGSGGGLAGIQIYQTQIFVYAREELNEPSCAVPSPRSQVTKTGPWNNYPSLRSYTDYVYAVPAPPEISSTQIIFQPDLRQSGNYTISVYTPGCLQDSSCSARGFVNVSGTLTTAGGQMPLSPSQLSQTNENDKYDAVYYGHIDAATSGFRPSVTIRPSGPQAQYIVASRVRFELLNSTGGLNGLYEWDPTNVTVNTDFAASAINSAGRNLKPDANVLALASHNSTMFSAGQYTDDDFRNIMSFTDNNVETLPLGGLNATVFTLYADNDYLYCGGNFTGTGRSGGPVGLLNIAAYNYNTRNWTAIGEGLDGPVELISPMPMNISSGNETVVAFSGTFKNIIAASGNIPANGFAIWVPSRKAWLASLPDVTKVVLAGKLSATARLPNGTWLGAGTLTSLGFSVADVASLQSASSGNARVQQLPVSFQPNSNSLSNSSSSRSLANRQTSFNDPTFGGVATGLYYKTNNRNVTVIAGQFTAAGSNSTTVQNLMFLNYSNNQYTTTGLPSGIDNSNSSFLAVATQNNLLIAGGTVTGLVGTSRISGVVIYDFDTSMYRPIQPAGLIGNNATVRAIAVQNGGSNVYVGGQFERTAQELPCRSVCAYDTSTNQWNQVGSQLSGTVVSLYWTSASQLMAAGNLTVSGNRTGLAVYDPKQQSWSTTGPTTIPGPISVFVPKDPDGSQSYVAGTASNGSLFLGHVSGNSYQPVLGLFQPNTTIVGLDMVPLTSNHPKNDFLDSDQALLVTGRLNITGFGPASGALFNGTNMTPFILASTSDGNSGVVNQFFTQRGLYFNTNRPKHSRGIAVLVALCAALGTIFLLILCGILLNYIQRRRAGYNTVPTVPYTDKHSNINRVPPERLFGTLGQRPGAPPTV